MSKYIDAEKLIAEVERRINETEELGELERYNELIMLETFITSLQQEQPEVDLEKACDAYCEVCGHYHHTTPTYICRRACDYFDDFKALLNNARKEE